MAPDGDGRTVAVVFNATVGLGLQLSRFGYRTMRPRRLSQPLFGAAGAGERRTLLGIRVLVVEDIRATHELITELLDFVGGFELVGTCHTESAALQWLHEHEGGCDLVLLDLMLREGSGFTVLSRLSAAGSPDVVVFSDFASPAVVR
jgi:PleD family two-component response regulator